MVALRWRLGGRAVSYLKVPHGRPHGSCHSDRCTTLRSPKINSMKLLKAWAAWRPHRAPFVLPADAAALLGGPSSKHTTSISGWRAAHREADFGAPGDRRLHLGLLPVPFVGDLRRASIYILLLNPGLGATDYFGEYEVPAFRTASLANLRQEEGRRYPFFVLDPQFAWHGGFEWWNQKLSAVILELAAHWQLSFAEARQRLAQKLACIELLPYHSSSFADRGRWRERLPSVSLAREFVHSTVLPRARAGKAIVIVTRQARQWGVPAGPGVVLYSGGHARGAHLTPSSPGGRAILQHLTRSGARSG